MTKRDNPKLHIKILARHLLARVQLDHALHERDDPAARRAVKRAMKAIGARP
jgi:hypothetical protein